MAAAQATAGTSGSTTATAANGVSWQLVSIGDAKYLDPTNKVPVSKAQCDADDLLHLSITFPTGYKYLEVYVGDNCNEGLREMRPAGQKNCDYVKTKEQDMTVTADSDFTIPVKQACDLGDGTRTFFILPVNTERGTDTATVFARVALVYDQTPPSAPTGVKGGAGETEISVGWTQPSDSYYFWIVTDSNVNASGSDGDAGGSNGGCSSSTLMAGADFDPSVYLNKPADGIWVKYLNSKSQRTTISGDDLGVTEGKAAVAVIAEDLAHNRSVLSNVDCVDVVPTVGFWDKYKSGGGIADEGCGCATLGAGRQSMPRIWSALCVAGAIIAVRKRARRRA